MRIYNGAPNLDKIKDCQIFQKISKGHWHQQQLIVSLVSKKEALQRGLELPDEGRPCLPLEEIEVWGMFDLMATDVLSMISQVLDNNRYNGMARISFVMKEGRLAMAIFSIDIDRLFEAVGWAIATRQV